MFLGPTIHTLIIIIIIIFYIFTSTIDNAITFRINEYIRPILWTIVNERPRYDVCISQDTRLMEIGRMKNDKGFRYKNNNTFNKIIDLISRSIAALHFRHFCPEMHETIQNGQ